MKHSEDMIKRIKEDDKYKKIIEATPDGMKEQVQATIEAFLNEMGKGLDDLKAKFADPELRKKFSEAMAKKHRGE